MQRRFLVIILTLVLLVSGIAFGVLAEDTVGMVLETAKVPDVLQAWQTGGYDYVKLSDAVTLSIPEEENLWVDLNGQTLTVDGKGTVYAFDSANDTYNADACGKVVNNGSVTVEQEVTALNGNRYLAVTKGNETQMHRLNVSMTAVNLRTADAGMYYSATYDCDTVLSSMVQSYGVVVSLANMPGSDFKTEQKDINCYTVMDDFESGKPVNSGAVVDIMANNYFPSTNYENAGMEIYANCYIDFGNGPMMGDTKNIDMCSSDAGFTGVAYSLNDILDVVEETYQDYSLAERATLDSFYAQWKNNGIFKEFTMLGSGDQTIANQKLVFDAGTTNAVCPVCAVKVTWTAITDDTKEQVLTGGHYYLTGSLTYKGTNHSYIYNGTSNTTACLHLNDFNITATQTKAIFGSSGRLNVMGNGDVSGYCRNGTNGSAVWTNNSAAGNGVYLYGGTYKNVVGSGSSTSVISIWDVGGKIAVYPGAKIEASGVWAVNVSTPKNADAVLTLQGCEVKGPIHLEGANPANTPKSIINLQSCNITNKVNINPYNDVRLSGSVKIKEISRHEDVRLDVSGLRSGASVYMATDGVFTNTFGNAAAFTQYFHSTAAAGKITVRNGALHCGRDYVSKLDFEGDTENAMCPACSKVVAWNKLTNTEAVTQLENGDHYYLADHFEYFGTNAAAVSAPGTNKTACLHLNGFNLTAKDTRAIYGSGGVLNVMGTGIVSGRVTDNNGPGSTVQINTGSVGGTVNLYGGTYRQAEDAASNEYTVNIANNGGTINIYEDATVEGNQAVKVNLSKMRDSELGVYGGTIKGKILSTGADRSCGFASQLVFDGGSVEGTVDVDGESKVTFLHAPVIELLDIEKTSKVTLERMKKGASITVLPNGVFTNAHEKAQEYAAYFKPRYPSDEIIIQDNMLLCRTRYNDALQLENNEAFCPVCKKTVEWQELSDESQAQDLSGGHYYLTKSLTYKGNGSSYLYNGTKGTVACLHLNGFGITATNTSAFFVSSGYLNVMGRGTVSGYSGAANSGAVVQANNSVAENGISLYGGTYRKTDTAAAAASVIALWENGGCCRLHDEVKVVGSGTGPAIFAGAAKYRSNELAIYGASVTGDITLTGATSTYASTFIGENVTVTGTVSVAGTNTVSFDGRTNLGKLVLLDGNTADFTNMLAGSSIKVSADGSFTPVLADADGWLQYFSTEDAGDWVIVRDKALYQGVKTSLTDANAGDITALDTAYDGRTVKYGEMHDHSSTGPHGDGKITLAQWKEIMNELKMDFATIVDHKQSVHMYDAAWDDTYFVGGSEPSTVVVNSKATNKTLHYNMLFSDPKDLEYIVTTFTEFGATNYAGGGVTFGYPNFTEERFAELANAVYERGGLLVHVHPKYDDYMVSDDPLDYWINDYTGFEITTGTGGNMGYKDNEEAYQTWVDLLEMGKKIFATSGSDFHNLPNTSALTTLYSSKDEADTYLGYMHNGDFAPGWVGIRMALGDATMGGTTSFEGQRLLFSVGQIHSSVYDETHTYRVQLYDDGGLLMESVIDDPTQLHYYAIDASADSKFYRVVVWDDTLGVRIGVGNPIWNG